MAPKNRRRPIRSEWKRDSECVGCLHLWMRQPEGPCGAVPAASTVGFLRPGVKP
jgi:hypothetical protein